MDFEVLPDWEHGADQPMRHGGGHTPQPFALGYANLRLPARDLRTTLLVMSNMFQL
jgi:hypothetical protein